jgi:hypothetical protein
MAGRTRENFICANCQGHYTWDQAHEQKTASRGKARYICNACNEIKSYGIGNTTPAHEEKKHGITIGFELECIPHNTQDYASMISAVYGMVPSSDCSLPTGGVEFNTPVYYSLNGIKSMFRTFERYADFQHHQCGQHINVGHVDLNLLTMQIIREYAITLFGPLMAAMYEDHADTVKVWGRDFNGYANYSTTFSRRREYCWINLDRNNRIEFRLAKFQNATQYFWLCNLCKEIMEIIMERFILGDHDEKTAKKVGKQLAKLYRKYADGNAHCQRPERNSKVS